MARPKFQEPDTYLRYYDFADRRWKYIWLIERDGPIIYPFRFASLAPGSEQSQASTFEDLATSETASHIYQVFLGLYPLTWYKLWHPYNVRLLDLDRREDDLNEDLTSILRYEESPHDAPQVNIWVNASRYPGIQPRNVGIRSFHPKIEFTIMKFRVANDEELTSDVKNELQNGTRPSVPITFGGEI